MECDYTDKHTDKHAQALATLQRVTAPSAARSCSNGVCVAQSPWLVAGAQRGEDLTSSQAWRFKSCHAKHTASASQPSVNVHTFFAPLLTKAIHRKRTKPHDRLAKRHVKHAHSQRFAAPVHAALEPRRCPERG